MKPCECCGSEEVRIVTVTFLGLGSIHGPSEEERSVALCDPCIESNCTPDDCKVAPPVSFTASKILLCGCSIDGGSCFDHAVRR